MADTPPVGDVFLVACKAARRRYKILASTLRRESAEAGETHNAAFWEALADEAEQAGICYVLAKGWQSQQRAILLLEKQGLCLWVEALESGAYADVLCL